MALPQFTLEFSSNIIEKNDMQTLFQSCHNILANILSTEIENCKSRAIECSNFYIGEMNTKSAFIHATLKVMPGRTKEKLAEVADAIMQTLAAHFAKSLHDLKLQITLELLELPNIYLKVSSQH